jgi:hypothetical protein
MSEKLERVVGLIRGANTMTADVWEEIERVLDEEDLEADDLGQLSDEILALLQRRRRGKRTSRRREAPAPQRT